MKKLIVILFPFVAFTQINNAEIQAEFTKLINAHRAEHGVAPLKPNADAQQAAKIQSDYLASTLHIENKQVKFRISHTHPEFPSPDDRLTEVNPALVDKFSTGENVAGFFDSNNPTSKDIAIQLFEQWKASPEHNKNMLLDEYSHFGLTVSISRVTANHTSPHTNDTHTITWVMYSGVTVFLWPIPVIDYKYKF